MEDILAIVVFFLGCAITGGFIHLLLKRHKQKVEAEQERQELISQHLLEVARETRKRERQLRTESIAAAIKNSPPPKTLNTVAAGVNVGRSTYASSATQSVRNYDTNTSDTLSDLANIAIIANTMNHWNDHSPQRTYRNEPSVGVTKTESSWGFDDSDSRKSVSSSMDTSSSWSSSDSSSSSDSGPSSDW